LTQKTVEAATLEIAMPSDPFLGFEGKAIYLA